jgi:hypothetical protein
MIQILSRFELYDGARSGAPIRTVSRCRPAHQSDFAIILSIAATAVANLFGASGPSFMRSAKVASGPKALKMPRMSSKPFRTGSRRALTMNTPQAFINLRRPSGSVAYSGLAVLVAFRPSISLRISSVSKSIACGAWANADTSSPPRESGDHQRGGSE